MDWCWESENELFLVAVHYIGLTHIRYASDNPMNLAFPNILLHPIKPDTLETFGEIWDHFFNISDQKQNVTTGKKAKVDWWFWLFVKGED